MTSPDPKQAAILRLSEALTHCREQGRPSTRAYLKSVANRFGVHPKSLEEGIKLEAKLSALALTHSK